MQLDPETVALMGRVCDSAWNEAQRWLSLAPMGDGSGLRETMALRIMAAVAHGERDPQRLRLICFGSARSLRSPVSADETAAPFVAFILWFEARASVCQTKP